MRVVALGLAVVEPAVVAGGDTRGTIEKGDALADTAIVESEYPFLGVGYGGASSNQRARAAPQSGIATANNLQVGKYARLRI